MVSGIMVIAMELERHGYILKTESSWICCIWYTEYDDKKGEESDIIPQFCEQWIVTLTETVNTREEKNKKSVLHIVSLRCLFDNTVDK